MKLETALILGFCVFAVGCTNKNRGHELEKKRAENLAIVTTAAPSDAASPAATPSPSSPNVSISKIDFRRLPGDLAFVFEISDKSDASIHELGFLAEGGVVKEVVPGENNSYSDKTIGNWVCKDKLPPLSSSNCTITLQNGLTVNWTSFGNYHLFAKDNSNVKNFHLGIVSIEKHVITRASAATSSSIPVYRIQTRISPEGPTILYEDEGSDDKSTTQLLLDLPVSIDGADAMYSTSGVPASLEKISNGLEKNTLATIDVYRSVKGTLKAEPLSLYLRPVQAPDGLQGQKPTTP